MKSRKFRVLFPSRYHIKTITYDELLEILNDDIKSLEPEAILTKENFDKLLSHINDCSNYILTLFNNERESYSISLELGYTWITLVKSNEYGGGYKFTLNKIIEEIK